MQLPSGLPEFWIFMYRLSPFTYWIGGVAGTQVPDRKVEYSRGPDEIFTVEANPRNVKFVLEEVGRLGVVEGAQRQI
jgi:hypothetical protein